MLLMLFLLSFQRKLIKMSRRFIVFIHMHYCMYSEEGNIIDVYWVDIKVGTLLICIHKAFFIPLEI